MAAFSISSFFFIRMRFPYASEFGTPHAHDKQHLIRALFFCCPRFASRFSISFFLSFFISCHSESRMTLMSLCNLSHRHFPRKHTLFALCARYEGDPFFVRFVHAEIEVTVNGLELKFRVETKRRKIHDRKLENCFCAMWCWPSFSPIHRCHCNFSRLYLGCCILKWTKKKKKKN